MAKIISFRTACQLSKKFRQENKTVLFTSGCFDILHIGHIKFFDKVRHWGGYNCTVFVGIENDKYIKQKKGNHHPYFNQKTRAKVISSLSQIDFVIILNLKKLTSDVFIDRNRQLNPSVVVFGNTELETIKRIKKQVKESGLKFKHLPDRTKPGSSSEIANILRSHFPP